MWVEVSEDMTFILGGVIGGSITGTDERSAQTVSAEGDWIYIEFR